LRDAVPRLSRLGFLLAPTRVGKRGTALLKEAAEKRRIALVGAPLASIDEDAYRRAFGTMAEEGADAVYVGDEAEHFGYQRSIIELAKQHRLPTIYPWREPVEIGGLMAYAFEFSELIRHDADAISQILEGAKPGDIPFYQARKFDLIINLKAAKTLGIDIPGSLRARADEVIE
jgi:putative ABC transport system substrate-binding protein